ncbi:hypothetical protein Ae406Ps2_0464c [Pseudonocardia sp. Ae406_Ps2]|nr:hypothetical protein Ae406Ps2_0464c [Pseudonocardia sp. Ae406_Ps2]OLM22038.1 hypothetical protein Ae706Ps2_0470c [Pseudonocardia sp. Ae706_Ps2]
MVRVQTNTVTSAVSDRTGRTAPRSEADTVADIRKKGSPQRFLHRCGLPFQRLNVGGDLLSHTLASAVPSALEGLATGFGMGPGVPLPQ